MRSDSNFDKRPSIGTRSPILPTAVALMGWIAATSGDVQAQSIPVANGSFESPTPPVGFPAFPQIDLWQKFPQPQGVPLPGGITWDQLSGVFPNTAPGTADHIDNVVGAQAAYLFAIPGVGISQQLESTYQPGNAYSLSVGILGAGGIAENSTFQIGLYYLDSANTPVSLGSTTVAYTAATFPIPNHLNDITASVPTVQAGDAWAGKKIGVQLMSTFGTGAGYWDVDNVRLTAIPEPTTTGLLMVGAASWFGFLLARHHRQNR